VARDVLGTVLRDGIAMAKVDDLIDPILTAELVREVTNFEEVRRDEIDKIRRGMGEGNKAHYRSHYLGARPRFDESSVFARFAMSPGIRGIANAYFGLEATLRHYNIWRTFPTSKPPSDSQLWHRDREDRFIFKAFLYLGDVDATGGPLTYVPGSHRRGRLADVAAPGFTEPGHANLRSRDDQMETVVPRTQWLEALGPRNTIVFVDTGGYHKGGFSTSVERLVYMCMYTSDASTVGSLFAND
jgi:hypothetical protein